MAVTSGHTFEAFTVSGWTVQKLPVGNHNGTYRISTNNLNEQRITFYFLNRRSAVTFCQLNPSIILIERIENENRTHINKSTH